MKFAYADPPYIGQARKHYKNESLCAEVNHELLVNYLVDSFDSWALSCSSPTLKQILELPAMPKDVRVAAWVKPFASFKPNVNPGYCWEPVIFYKSRKRGRFEATVRDFHSANITLKKGLSGAKPESFCEWIIELLGVQPEDEFTDVFPGTGIMQSVYEKCVRPSLTEIPDLR